MIIIETIGFGSTLKLLWQLILINFGIKYVSKAIKIFKSVKGVIAKHAIDVDTFV